MARSGISWSSDNLSVRRAGEDATSTRHGVVIDSVRMGWWPPRAWLPKSPVQWALTGVAALVVVLLVLLLVVPGLLGRGAQAIHLPRLGGSATPSASASPTESPSPSPSASPSLPAGGQPAQQSGVPRPRAHAQIAYDADTQSVVLFGG